MTGLLDSSLSGVPVRLQHRRGVALPPGARYVGRPSRWGNPYVFEAHLAKPGRVLVGSRAEAVERYADDLLADPARVDEVRRELAGHDLACYCSFDDPCHGDVLLAVASGELGPSDEDGPAGRAGRAGDQCTAEGAVPAEAPGRVEAPTVRVAQAEDLPLLADIERDAGERFRDVGLGSVADDDPPPRAVYAEAQRRGHLWVATLRMNEPGGDDAGDAEEVVGYAWALDLEGQPHLEQISVLPQHGGRGVGVALVDRVAAWAAKMGGTSLTLSTFVDVPWNGPWYERLGFVAIDAAELASDRRWQELRAHEAAAGLDLSRRTIMRRPSP